MLNIEKAVNILFDGMKINQIAKCTKGNINYRNIFATINYFNTEQALRRETLK